MSASRQRARCPFGWTANRCPGCDRRCSPQGPAEMATLFLRRFRFRSGAKDPERNTLRNAVINWPDGDEGEKSHFRDGSSTDLTAPKFDFRSSPESGRKSDIGPCPVRARNGLTQLSHMDEQTRSARP